MAIKSLNDAVEKLEEYLKLEKSFGLDELECNPSVFKNFHDEENDNIPLLIQGKKNKPDIQFIGIKSNKQQKNIFGRSYAYGTARLIFIHFFINVGMSIGLVPTIGIPLPFISYGGSSMFTFTSLVFVYLNIDANRLNETRV